MGGGETYVGARLTPPRHPSARWRRLSTAEGWSSILIFVPALKIKVGPSVRWGDGSKFSAVSAEQQQKAV
ncbi:hypothetical protein J2W68_001030 [Luteimonas terrae]|uniref:Uncharacterized protein n=1 Tax=Luteimonas terrae TaxID=1530191 RepID=A0ABU1XU71_9GAMM|nr:hypothetical protein [Luteimonas terrae]